MEIQKKKNKTLKNIVIFVLGCILLSGIIKAGSKYYLDNHWSPGIENRLLNECITGLTGKTYEGKEISNEAITSYCNCSLKKIKSNYKPKELSTVSKSEFETVGSECLDLLKEKF